jgi:hypothetical protein
MITLDGPTGSIVDGNVVTIPTGIHNKSSRSCDVLGGIQSDFRTLMRWSDQYRRSVPENSGLIFLRTPLMVHAKSWNDVYRVIFRIYLSW